MSPDRFAFCVPFRDLAHAVDEWREKTCATKPSHGVPPHVTLLVPAPPDVDGASQALAAFGAFDVSFGRLERFPGTLWLAPDPSEPLVAMTTALMERFPDHAPYEGQFEGIIPHLTLAQGEDLDRPAAAIEPLLPLGSRASTVVLFQQVAPDRWRELDELPL